MKQIKMYFCIDKGTKKQQKTIRIVKNQHLKSYELAIYKFCPPRPTSTKTRIKTLRYYRYSDRLCSLRDLIAFGPFGLHLCNSGLRPIAFGLLQKSTKTRITHC